MKTDKEKIDGMPFEFEEIFRRFTKYNERYDPDRAFCLVASNGEVWRKRFLREHVWAKSFCVFESGLICSYLFDWKMKGYPTHIESDILRGVLRFCASRGQARIMTRGRPEKEQQDALNEIDAEFLRSECKSMKDLVKYLDAACDLRIKSLMDLTSNELIKMIGEMDTADILKMFDLKEKMTVKEMEQPSKMFLWAFK